MNFLNHSSSMSIQSKDSHADVANFFSGNTSVSNVTSYGEIWYSNVYSNGMYAIILQQKEHWNTISFASRDSINLKLLFNTKVEHMEVLPNGHLQMKTSVGNVDFPAPVVYQKLMVFTRSNCQLFSFWWEHSSIWSWWIQYQRTFDYWPDSTALGDMGEYQFLWWQPWPLYLGRPG